MSNEPRAMRTNGIGRFCDWLNHDVSVADHPEFFSAVGGQNRKDGYLPPCAGLTWNGRPISPSKIMEGRHAS